MSRNRFSRTLLVAFAVGLLTAGAIAAQGPITTNPGAAQIEWQAGVEGALVLSVSGPGDFHHQERFAPGEAAVFSVFDEAGGLRPAGGYTFEVRLEPVLDEQTQRELRTAREAGEGAGTLRKAGKIPSEPIVHSGYFAIEGGAVVLGGDEEPTVDKPTGTGGGASLATKDQVIFDDLIVDGSACIGQDCVNGESFGFDTIRLKENNLRIKFEDTSTAGSFPSNDWQLTANDSSNGGANKFSIDDIDGGRTPFTIEASAPSHSLYVDDGGRVGFGTSTPVVELHVKDGDSPTLRLEQDGSSGFAPQTWDLAGNETNFFVRDASNGSKLPFRIRPSAPTNSIFIDTDGDVGLGTASPSAKLQILGNLHVGDGTTVDFGSDEVRLPGGSANVTGDQTHFNFGGDGRNYIRGTTIIADGGGNVGIGTASPDASAMLDVNGAIYQRGSVLHSDYVFEAAYELESIEEHSEFMWQNKHLPALKPRQVDENGQEIVEIGAQRRGILEELEKAHIYIEQLHERLAKLEEELAEK